MVSESVLSRLTGERRNLLVCARRRLETIFCGAARNLRARADAPVRILSKLLDIEKGFDKRKRAAIDAAAKREKKKAKKVG